MVVVQKARGFIMPLTQAAKRAQTAQVSGDRSVCGFKATSIVHQNYDTETTTTITSTADDHHLTKKSMLGMVDVVDEPCIKK